MIIKSKGKRGKRGIRKCKRCGQEFSELMVKIRKGHGIFCSNECYKLYRKEHKVDDRYSNIIYQKKCKYGLSKDEYEKLLSESKNICCVCGKEFNDKNRACVDHDHKTNKVRGLICSKCNTLIGFANEDIGVLERAIQYLKRCAEDTK